MGFLMNESITSFYEKLTKEYVVLHEKYKNNKIPPEELCKTINIFNETYEDELERYFKGAE